MGKANNLPYEGSQIPARARCNVFIDLQEGYIIRTIIELV